MDRTELLDILKGNISLIDAVNVNDFALHKVKVIVRPNDVRKMLQAYLKNNINAQQLSKWAKFICTHSGEYCSVHYESDMAKHYDELNAIADYYEDMFYVIQRLSTPEIDGEINEERVRQYLCELSKYSD